jgi:hypothetical protein
MREKITTIADIAGALAVTTGTAILFGAGVACVVGGALVLLGSFLAGNA